jgi:hypothetical protein
VGRGLLAGGIALGGLAFLWGFLLLSIFALLAAGGTGALLFLPVPVVAFGAGVTSIGGGIVGRHRLEFGSGLILVAGIAGLIAPAPSLLLNLAPTTTVVDILIAYLAVGWWAIAMVWLGGGVLLWSRRRAAVNDGATGP